MSNGDTLSTSPTKSFLDHLQLREGFRADVYLDSLGKPTGGTGHLLTESERAIYKVGDMPGSTVTKRWLAEDSKLAYGAGLSQATELGIKDQGMIEALGNVNFQLGTNWRSKFGKTWGAMESGDFDLAASEAMFKTPGKNLELGPPEPSEWMKQTPTRVNDFVSALKSYGSSQEHSKNLKVAGDAMQSIENPF